MGVRVSNVVEAEKGAKALILADALLDPSSLSQPTDTHPFFASSLFRCTVHVSEAKVTHAPLKRPKFEFLL